MPVETPWVVKGVSESTRRSVKAFAAQEGLTMGQALDLLIARGLKAGVTVGQNNSDVFSGISPLNKAELIKLLASTMEDMRRNRASEEQDEDADEEE